MKRYFLTRTRREQILVVVLAVAAALVWLSSSLDRMNSARRTWSNARSEHESQELWLAQRERIDARAADAIRSLDPRQTYDPTRLQAQITALASAAGLSVNTDRARTVTSGQLAVHNVQVNCRRASLANIIKFYEGVKSKAPYLVLESCTLQTERGAANTLGASFVLSSVEVLAPISD